MNDLPKVMYVFDCPVHGSECEVFCFRYIQPENRNKWKKFFVMYEELEISEDDIDIAISNVERNYR